MSIPITENIDLIDGHYHAPGRAGAYLVVEGDECALIDNITSKSASYMMAAIQARGLAPEQVRYLIPTHLHLDHAGGTAEMAKLCPNAEIICHPRAEKHFVDPTRLVASSKMVHGEEAFASTYGEIEPVPADRIRTAADGENLDFGNSVFTLYDSPGHARHHLVVHIPSSDTVVSGDAFGSCFPQLQQDGKPYLNYVCAPPEFEPLVATETINRIVDLNPARVCVTHFGQVTEIKKAAAQLTGSLSAFENFIAEAVDGPLEGDALQKACSEFCDELTQRELRERGLDPDDSDIHHWAYCDLGVTESGVAVAVTRRRKAKSTA